MERLRIPLRRARSFDEELRELRDRLDAESNFRPEHQNQAPSKWKINEETGEIKPGGQLVALNSLLGEFVIGRKQQRKIRLDILSYMLGRRINSSEDLTKWEATCIIEKLKESENWHLSGEGRKLLDQCLRRISSAGVTGAPDPYSPGVDAPLDPQETGIPPWALVPDLLEADDRV
jgi:hypothetical protein